MNQRTPLFPHPHESAEKLAQHYRAGLSFFASPTQTLLAGPALTTLPPLPQTSLIARTEALLRHAANAVATPILVGAVPFDMEQAAHLFVPGMATRAGMLHSRQHAGAPRTCVADSSQCIPSALTFRGNVAAALDSIRGSALQKVVLSRSINVATRIDLPLLLQCLLCRNVHGYTYAIDLGDRTLIGASPELLLSKRGHAVISRPLAGSIPRAKDPEEDARRAASLLRSTKDQREHALVVDAVAAALSPYCRKLEVPPEPTLVSTATMWHLGSEVRGELSDDSIGALELALALHPTPAVCGHPRAAARAFINATEGFKRGFFTGLVGWSDAKGDGEWAVTIRCAEIDAQSATLYAGAGIVEGSDPALELAETSAKLLTMLSAMGLDEAVELEA